MALEPKAERGTNDLQDIPPIVGPLEWADCLQLVLKCAHESGLCMCILTSAHRVIHKWQGSHQLHEVWGGLFLSSN